MERIDLSKTQLSALLSEVTRRGFDIHLTPMPKKSRRIKGKGCKKRDRLYITFDGETLPVSEMAKKHGLNPSTLASRINRGYSVVKALGQTDYRTI